MVIVIIHGPSLPGVWSTCYTPPKLLNLFQYGTELVPKCAGCHSLQVFVYIQISGLVSLDLNLQGAVHEEFQVNS